MPLLFSSKVSLTALYLPSPSLYHPIAPINLTNIRSSRTLPPTPTENLPTSGMQESTYLTLIHNELNKLQTQHECFLCSLDSQACAIPKLEGYIIHAH